MTFEKLLPERIRQFWSGKASTPILGDSIQHNSGEKEDFVWSWMH